MYPTLTPSSLDEWMSSFDSFRYDFLRYCQIQAKAVGYTFEHDQPALAAAHGDWVEDAGRWLAELVMPDTRGLSHLKLCAILLHCLATSPWMRDLYEFDPAADGLEGAFVGDAEERAEVRRDLNAGREAYFAFEFCLLVVTWFERDRIDRAQPFEFRLTHDLRHDLLVYLVSGRSDPLALFLVLKALFARDPR